MNLNSQVAVVSAFGRGHWLAAELQSKGLQVTVLDVTSSMGHWAPEDWEGPFGYFRSLLSSQIERLQADDVVESVSTGMNVWLSSGPLELKSSLTQHRLEKLKIPAWVRDYLEQVEDTRKSNTQSVLDKISLAPFDYVWLAYLGHSLASPVLNLDPRSVLASKSLPLFQDYEIRHATRPGLQKSIEWLRANSVTVIEDVTLMDVATQSSRVAGIEMKSPAGSGLFRQEQLVWCLSSEESFFLTEAIGEKLFKKIQEPEWAWVRYGLSFADVPEREVFPAYFVMLNDVYLPWSHENFISVKRRQTHGHFDAWIRIPNTQRFNKQYLTDRGEKILQTFARRLPPLAPAITDYPQEYNYTYQELGASRFGVFKELDSENIGRKFENVYFDSIETCGNLSWHGVFDHQKNISEVLSAWWQQELIRKQKKEKQ